MKVLVNKTEKQSKYPYVGIYEDVKGTIIVLFHKKGTGICLDHYIVSEIGKYIDIWAEEDFTKCSVTID